MVRSYAARKGSARIKLAPVLSRRRRNYLEAAFAAFRNHAVRRHGRRQQQQVAEAHRLQRMWRCSFWAWQRRASAKRVSRHKVIARIFSMKVLEKVMRCECKCAFQDMSAYKACMQQGTGTCHAKRKGMRCMGACHAKHIAQQLALNLHQVGQAIPAHAHQTARAAFTSWRARYAWVCHTRVVLLRTAPKRRARALGAALAVWAAAARRHTHVLSLLYCVVRNLAD